MLFLGKINFFSFLQNFVGVKAKSGDCCFFGATKRVRDLSKRRWQIPLFIPPISAPAFRLNACFRGGVLAFGLEKSDD